jgi:hypothetical protein
MWLKAEYLSRHVMHGHVFYFIFDGEVFKIGWVWFFARKSCQFWHRIVRTTNLLLQMLPTLARNNAFRISEWGPRVVTEIWHVLPACFDECRVKHFLADETLVFGRDDSWWAISSVKLRHSFLGLHIARHFALVMPELRNRAVSFCDLRQDLIRPTQLDLLPIVLIVKIGDGDFGSAAIEKKVTTLHWYLRLRREIILFLVEFGALIDAVTLLIDGLELLHIFAQPLIFLALW